MNAVKLIVAIAVLAVTACQVSSPTGLSQDSGSLQTSGEGCGRPDASPC